MITRMLNFVEWLTGGLLGGIGVGVQVGNVLVCVFMIVLGPVSVAKLFS